ncbi:MAG: DUF58 domain-containing protein [Planctomycetia bacterium]|nr:DUF58 domain-containing protein [Planctomycetia bacterium]
MLTSRGYWFLIVVAAFLAVAALVPPDGHLPLTLVSLTLLLWFLGEWLVFATRLQLAVPQIVVERALHDERGVAASLWAERSFEVRVKIRLQGLSSLPYVRLGDRAPFGVEQPDGQSWWEGSLAPDAPAEIRYRIRCLGVGLVRFEGVSVEVADLQGFFYHRTFVTAVVVRRVLPILGDVDATASLTKRYNLLPPPGVHRHRRPGSGSELLDLRDYLPGDPPRTIAWKVSARRDKLITKEFESDVPVRCTLLVDVSNSVRLGAANRTALSRLAEIAAAVAQASIGNRDPVGLALFDEHGMQLLRPARTRRHLSDVMNLLADAAGQEPATGEADTDTLLPLGHAFAQEVYPEQLRPEVNAFPGWLAWLAPRSIWTIPHPRLADFLYWLFPYIAVVVGGLSLYGATALWVFLAKSTRGSAFGPRNLGIAALALSALALLLMIFRILTMLFPRRRRMYRWRKQMAAVLSVRDGLAPGGLGLLLEDDRQFAVRVQRFLAEHRVPLPLPLYDSHGRYRFASPEKIDVLANSLLRAVGKGHDNEMFVLLADLLELTERLEPLLKAVKVTLARHHQVLVVCPWPPGIPPPGRTGATVPRAHPPGTLAGAALVGDLDPTIREAITQRFHAAFFELRRTFARLGVPVICAQGEEPARLIVERLDRLRTVRSAPRV